MSRSSFALLVVPALSALVLGCSNSSRPSTLPPAATAPTTTATPTPPTLTEFEVEITNASNASFLATPLSPGVWAIHSSTTALFASGAAASVELETLAEDGDAGPLASEVAIWNSVAQSGTFGGLPPGGTQTFTVQADPSEGNLSLARMLVQSNDLLLATSPTGVALFDSQGGPLAEHTITLSLWDAGSELNELPAAGPNQPLRQAAPNTGPAEGVVSLFSSSTRALPPAASIARVTVTETGGTYTIRVQNVSTELGRFATPLAPLFWAVHDAGYSLFTVGQAAPANGLETLAEDGSPMGLAMNAASDAGVASSGAQTTTVERPLDPAGPAAPGERFEIAVTPDAQHPQLTLACMIVASNDAFLALPAQGIALLDAAGAPRPAAEVEAEIETQLAVWDAGTEANQVPGAGSNQPASQAAPNTGPADSDPLVRRYADTTVDVSGPRAGGFAQVTVADGAVAGEYQLTLHNQSGAGSFTGVLTPVVWAVHDANPAVFTPGSAASAGLEVLAESGNPMPLAAELGSRAGVGSSGVANTPTGASAPGPLPPGGTYVFTVQADAAHRYLSLASMIVPSNDTFLSVGPTGVALLDAGGQPRPAADIAAEFSNALVAWDAGTEANQVGAAGIDQAPRQATPDAGAGEGTGTVRPYDGTRRYPRPDQLIRITIRPLQTP